MYDKARLLHSSLKPNPLLSRMQQLFPNQSDHHAGPNQHRGVKANREGLAECRTWVGGSCPCDTLFNAGSRAWFRSACSSTTGFAEGASLLAVQGPLEHGFRIGTEDYCCPEGFLLPAVGR